MNRRNSLRPSEFPSVTGSGRTARIRVTEKGPSRVADKTETAPAKPAPKVDSTLAKGLSILEALADAREPRGVSELARELDLTKSNVFRLLQSLSTLGYVRPTEDKRYKATLKTWQVGRAVVENFNLREMASAAMQMLSTETGETVYLAVPDGLSIVYIDKIESTRPIRTWNPVAGSAPLYCVGTGKAILAANYERLRDRMTGQLRKHTDRTITSMKALDEEMLLTRRRGYAVDRGEFRDRIRSYGAAIHLPDGEALAAVGISVPEVNMTEGDEQRFCDLVKIAAETVTHRLRHV